MEAPWNFPMSCMWEPTETAQSVGDDTRAVATASKGAKEHGLHTKCGPASVGGKPGPSTGAPTRTRAEANVRPPTPCKSKTGATQRKRIEQTIPVNHVHNVSRSVFCPCCVRGAFTGCLPSLELFLLFSHLSLVSTRVFRQNDTRQEMWHGLGTTRQDTSLEHLSAHIISQVASTGVHICFQHAVRVVGYCEEATTPVVFDWC